MPPLLRIRVATSASESILRAHSATLAPALVSVSAKCAPNPPFAPVTSATRSSSLRFIPLLLFHWLPCGVAVEFDVCARPENVDLARRVGKRNQAEGRRKDV